MNVAFLIYSLNRGGAERSTVNLANHFSEKGWGVCVITIRDDIDPAYTLDSKVKLVAMGLHSNSNTLLAGILNNLKRIQFIRRVVRDNGINVLIGMSSSANVLVALACLATSSFAIGSERSHPENKPISISWSLFRRYGYRFLDLLICLTNETKQWLNTETNAKNIVTIPNGVVIPLAANTPVIPYSFNNKDKKYLISVSRLVQSKCLDQSIRSFANLSQYHPDWEFLVIGDGPEMERLQSLQNELGLEDKVHLLGSVGNLDDWYPNADIFVSSSIHEGFPNSLLEAMSYGLAVISYDCPTGPKDLIDHEVNGLLVPLGNEKALEAALSELMGNNSKRLSYGSQARFCREKYSMRSVGQSWVAEVSELFR